MQHSVNVLYVARKAVVAQAPFCTLFRDPELAQAPVCTLFRDPELGEEYRQVSRSMDECDVLTFNAGEGAALLQSPVCSVTVKKAVG